ncbi:MAG: endonuclease III [Thermoprotei archaeon]
MDREKFAQVIRTLESLYPRELPSHIREDPYRTLIGCILSARTKDEFTDKAYNALFSKYPTPQDMLAAPEEDIRQLIRPVNFYITKAGRIKKATAYIVERFQGKVPDDREKLLEIPGIGEKCADIVLGYAFGHNTVAVDTHVDTVAKRLGVCAEDAEYAEVKAALIKLAPKDKIWSLNNLFVEFGQQICTKNNPKCYACPIYNLCEWPGKRLRKSVKRDRRRKRTRD